MRSKLKIQLIGIIVLLSLVNCLETRGENSTFDKYRVIIESNLFLPLGWKPPKTRPPFILSGIVKSGSRKYAFIRRKDRKETYLVKTGQIIPNGWKVTQIDVQKRTVTLCQGEEKIQLKLPSFILSSSTLMLEPSKLGIPLPSLGFITDWWVIGPFDNENGEGFDRVYPPEEEINLKMRYQGVEGEVGWKRITSSDSRGVVNLIKALGNKEWVVAYAYTEINSPQAKDVKLTVGSDDGVKMWVNGELVLSRDLYRGVDFQPDTLRVTLQSGRNQLLLKITQGVGYWEFFVKVEEGR
jgi:hypothetical protein